MRIDGSQRRKLELRLGRIERRMREIEKRLRRFGDEGSQGLSRDREIGEVLYPLLDDSVRDLLNEYPLQAAKGDKMSWTIRDIMEKDVQTVTPEVSLSDLERQLLHGRVGALPVVDRDGQLVGIASRSDVVRQLSVERSLGEAMADTYREHADESWYDTSSQELNCSIGQRVQRLRVRDVMIKDVVTISPDCAIELAADCFVKRHIHRLPVVEDGRLVGIVSTLDLARLMAEGDVVQA
jgi:CBS domain-containing protein